MLMPLPATLHRLLAEYERLLAEETATSTTSASQRLQDVTYTLCVSTGTREISDALDTARAYLAKATATPLGDRHVITSPPKQTATAATSSRAAGNLPRGQVQLASTTARADER
ncbi:DUF5133 domain-containing protein [Streptomyces sp. NPDC048512]|uniref:DUF5133 domain-containing protein n=1 Tax=unclassified Streptomyces TaxID=2593676 RepID=UPI0009BE40E7|nr:DUF5133 domain-containing protein [Streptomyces sp. M41(2017)]OQQ13859.1 hypothetical protein B0675_26925 [Streptomyces sp. M41(2017)]